MLPEPGRKSPDSGNQNSLDFDFQRFRWIGFKRILIKSDRLRRFPKPRIAALCGKLRPASIRRKRSDGIDLQLYEPQM